MEPPILYDFCRAVTDQLRCRAEVNGVYEELYGHLQDHAEALVRRGADETEAQRSAVAAMGDPVELGKALDRLHSPWPWRVLHASLLLSAAALCLALCLTLADPDGGWPGGGETAFYLDSGAVLAEYEDVLGARVLATGKASGCGRLGPYLLWAPGGAEVVQYESGGEVLTQLVFPVHSAHWEPWLGGLDCYDAIPATDELGNRYLAYPSPLDGRMVGLHRVVLAEPDPAANRFTFTLSTDRGTVRFTVELEGRT